MHALPRVVATPACRLGQVKPDPDRGREAVLAAVAYKPALDIDGTVDCVGRAFECQADSIGRRNNLGKHL
ncbi:MAG TPA: hypothetical protein VIV06_06010 [Candidatus Limnocylindrales bacterium]